MSAFAVPCCDRCTISRKTRVQLTTFVAMPVLSGTLALAWSVLNADSLGSRPLTDAMIFAGFALLWACPLTIIAPLVLARLAQRATSPARYLLASAGAGGLAALLIALVLVAPSLSPVRMLWNLATVAWTSTSALAFAGSALLAGPVPAGDQDRPIDTDGLIVKGIGYGLVVVLGWAFLVLASV